MKKSKFSLARHDYEMESLVLSTDKRILAHWAIDCTLRVLNFFEDEYPKDKRPRIALEVLQAWINSWIFNMKTIRKASLDSHAAAREVWYDTPARSAARAAGHAVATVHVARHAYGPAIYGQQAIFRASSPADSEINVLNERNWQFKRLLELREEYKL